MDWRSITIYGVSLEKITSEFVMFHEKLPYMKCKVRVVERANDFKVYSNIQVKDYINNSVDGICGLGGSEEEAINDLIVRLIDMIDHYEGKYGRQLTEDDFEYVDPHDF